ncbi:MAG: hypothetical protein K0R07_2252 [Sedimentibacter sp.]|jgi:hypothetical protein|nr:hypothetical protein [Sedimentibacter sp.]
MKNNNIEQLKKEYMDIPIPEELDLVVENALKNSMIYTKKRKNRYYKTSVTAAAALMAFTVLINTSPVFAETLSAVPIMKNVIKVLTFREYIVKENTYNAEMKVPSIEGLNNKTLESSLNKKYIEENKKLYEEFLANMESLKKNNSGQLGVNSGYVVKTDTDTILSIGRYVVNTVGSSSTTFKYDTIDKKNEVLISLPSLFKDESYINIISDNIKKQMVEQYEADKNKFYWVLGIEQKSTIKPFEKISKDQNFYINTENKLVISFNKYDVAPGYMGIVEFTIPTEIISNILVSTEYIK